MDFHQAGSYQVTGTVYQQVEFPFPLPKRLCGSDVLHWNGKYYFLTATLTMLITLAFTASEADTVEGLFNGAEEHLEILDKDEQRAFCKPLGP